ncbi:macrophage mannose receptor 1-like [Saccoglossus kowalevskii]
MGRNPKLGRLAFCYLPSIYLQGVENDLEDKAGRWNDDGCSKLRPSVCKKDKEVLPPTTASSGDCASGWTSFHTSCYQFESESPQSWDSAQSRCQQSGGNLVTVNDNVEQAFLTSQLTSIVNGDMYWIGLSDTNEPGTYEWVDGQPVQYSNWDNEQPDPTTGDCVAMASGKIGAGLWSGIPCGESHAYVCEKLKPGYTPVPGDVPVTSPSDNGCSAGWTGYGNNCFREYEQLGDYDRKTWTQAEEYCKNMGGHLASFHSNEEELYVIDNIGTDNWWDGFWIGLNDQETESGFKWSDGSAVSYTRWNDGEPNDAENEDCVEMFFSTESGWNDVDCDRRRNWICKIPKDITPVTLPPPITATKSGVCHSSLDWYLYDESCYYFSDPSDSINGRQGWSDARSYCYFNGGDLVSIHSVDEQRFIHQMQQESSWIGIREYGAGNTYEWSDGTPVDYVNWAEGEPNDSNGEEQCAEMRKGDGSWNDLNCGDRLTFVCRKYVGAPLPTHDPTSPTSGNCPSGFMEYGGKCYSFNGEDAGDIIDWYGARDRCRAQDSFGGDLVTIHSQELQAFLTSNLRDIRYSMWIGLSDTIDEQRYRWTDGSPVNYYNWNSGEPNGGDQVRSYLMNLSY